MKNVISVLLCALLCVFLTACGGSPVSGTWKYSSGSNTSTIKFKSNEKVVWTLEENGEKQTYEGYYSYDEVNEEVTVVLDGWGSGTYDVNKQIDFIGLPHRK